MKAAFLVLLFLWLNNNLLKAQAGSLDPDFGTDGVVAFDINNSSDDLLNSSVLQPDGKIIVGGLHRDGSNTNSFDFLLLRFLSNGTLDKDFGEDGKVVTDIQGAFDRGTSLHLLPDGKIMLAGTTRLNSQEELAFVRYLPDGSLDPDFGIDGIFFTSLGLPIGSTTQFLFLPDGKILAYGASSEDPLESDFTMIRFFPDGSVDTSFGTDGIAAGRCARR